MPAYKIKLIPEELMQFRKQTGSVDLLTFKDEALEERSM
jgi:hypothetical protein